MSLVRSDKLRRSGPILVGHHLRNGDGASWRQGREHLAQQLPAAPLALTVQNVPQRRHIVAGVVIDLEQITGESLAYSSDAPDDVRLKQVAHLRAKLERRRAG